MISPSWLFKCCLDIYFNINIYCLFENLFIILAKVTSVLRNYLKSSKIESKGAGETTRQLSAFPALTENSHVVHNSHSRQLTTALIQHHGSSTTGPQGPLNSLVNTQVTNDDFPMQNS